MIRPEKNSEKGKEESLSEGGVDAFRNTLIRDLAFSVAQESNRARTRPWKTWPDTMAISATWRVASGKRASRIN
ncbi:MAG: hypothetical protein U9N82_05345 [Thermodesulfobacteriota bacterium]|nr:hypothetical protein [Thermodesulfobacteriota bacterium]